MNIADDVFGDAVCKDTTVGSRAACFRKFSKF